MATVPASTLINGRFLVLKELGEGGMGRVFLVEDTCRDGALLAFKMILPETANEEFLQRFRVEFAQLAKLRHPSLASAHDFGRLAGSRKHFFTTDFVPGIDLFKATAHASADQILDITTQLLRGLDFIHSHGFLHNDLKPSNILLEPLSKGEQPGEPGNLMRLEATVFGVAGRVKIIDFGLLSQENVAWERIMGTPGYLSPERISCDAADRRSDLYSLGCILYLLCARNPVFENRDVRALLKMHLEAPPPQLLKHCPALPPPLAELTHRLLQKDPRERFESAGAALRFLTEALGWDKNNLEMRAKTPEISAGSLFERGTELTLLEHRFRALTGAAGDCPCVVVEGPAGIGKTRLVNELRGLVQVSGGAFVQIGGRGIEGHLQPVLEALFEGLETSGAPGVDSIRKNLGGLSKDAAGDLSFCLQQVVFLYAARMPLLIHFDDFQRATPTVRRFAVELVQSAWEKGKETGAMARLMLVLCRRIENETEDLHISSLQTLRLEPFSSQAMKEFLRRLFAQDDIPESMLWTLEKTTQGNPGLLVEVAKYLVEKNHVKYSGSRWVFPSSLDGISLPDCISSAMEKKIAGLDKDSVRILELFSVSSTPVPARVIKRGLLLGNLDVPACLGHLVKKGLLVAEEKDGLLVYGFAHPPTRKAVEEKLSKEQGKFLHQRLVQSLEEEFGDRPARDESFCETLAHHWMEAGNEAGFLRYAASAASHLQKCGNLELAAEYHRRIADGMPSEAAATKIKSLAKLSEMHEFLWDLDKSKRDLREILELGGELLPASDRVSLLRRLAGMEIAMNRFPAALQVLGEARGALPSAPDPLLEVSLDAPEAWARWFCRQQSDGKALVARAEKALQAGWTSDARRKTLAVGALNHLANLHHQLGRLSLAVEMYERNLTLLHELKLPQAEAATRCSLGSVLLDAGNPSRAFEELGLALKTAREIGDRRTLCRARERLGEYHLRHGDLKSALQITQVGLQDAESIRNSSATANSLRTLGRIYLRAGQHDAAGGVLAKALKMHVETCDPIGTPLSRIALARLRLEEEDVPQALEHLTRASEEAQHHELTLARGLSSLLRAEAEYLVSRQAPAELIQAAEESFRSSGFLSELCETVLFSARIALERGEIRPASEKLAQIEPTLQRAGSIEQRAHGQYLHALIDALEGKLPEAIERLSSLEILAKNSVLPRVAAWSREARQRLEAVK
jgi:tetratricopeptide (TPR) repeat protein